MYDDVRNWVPQLKKENIAANQPILDVVSRFAVMKQAANAQIFLAWMLHKYPKTLNSLIKRLQTFYKDNPDVDPYKMAYGLMPSQAVSCPKL